MKNEKGLTLIEILIALFLIGVISCITLPSMHILERITLKVTAQKLQMDIRMAQRLAIKEGKNYWVKFIKSDNKYFITSNVFKEPYKRVSLDTKITMTYVKFGEGISDKEIKFNPKGTISQGGRVELRTKHYYVKITALPATGRVKIYYIN